MWCVCHNRPLLLFNSRFIHLVMHTCRFTRNVSRGEKKGGRGELCVSVGLCHLREYNRHRVSLLLKWLHQKYDAVQVGVCVIFKLVDHCPNLNYDAQYIRLALSAFSFLFFVSSQWNEFSLELVHKPPAADLLVFTRPKTAAKRDIFPLLFFFWTQGEGKSTKENVTSNAPSVCVSLSLLTLFFNKLNPHSTSSGKTMSYNDIFVAK